MKVRANVPFLALLAAVAFIAPFAVARDDAHKKAPQRSGLDRFRQLAGEWTGTMKDENGKEMPDVVVKYSVTSAGSAVIETIGPGTPHEMVTVIHEDGNDLALTHYCAIGNQPRMKAPGAGNGNKVEFDFTGASNMQSDKDMHMHAVTFTFIDKDTIKTVWATYVDGKKSGSHSFDLKRKK